MFVGLALINLGYLDIEYKMTTVLINYGQMAVNKGIYSLRGQRWKIETGHHLGHPNENNNLKE